MALLKVSTCQSVYVYMITVMAVDFLIEGIANIHRSLCDTLSVHLFLTFRNLF